MSEFIVFYFLQFINIVRNYFIYFMNFPKWDLSTFAKLHKNKQITSNYHLSSYREFWRFLERREWGFFATGDKLAQIVLFGVDLGRVKIRIVRETFPVNSNKLRILLSHRPTSYLN